MTNEQIYAAFLESMRVNGITDGEELREIAEARNVEFVAVQAVEAEDDKNDV